jgi:hypothetical protein
MGSSERKSSLVTEEAAGELMKKLGRLRIVLSSPRDLVPAIKKIAAAVIKVSRQTEDAYGISFDSISANSGIYGGIAAYAQAGINPQLKECDIYIGLMWTRAGTDTQKCLSGTAEEFEEFLKRWRKKEHVEIRFYFLDKSTKVSALEPGQLKKLKKFQSQLNGAGVYFKTLDTVAEIIDDITGDIHKIAQGWKSRARRSKRPLKPRPKMKTSAAKMSRRVRKSLLKSL